jgi:TP901 family phage tail tape measure protein
MADLALNIRIKAFDETKGTIKGLRGDLGGGRGGMRRQGAAAKRTRREAEAAGRSVADMGRAAEGLLRGPVQASLEYEKSLANISTLGTDISGGALEDITRQASLQFGGTSAEQAGALYDIISAGATNATQAQKTLDAANKLSIGGLTDVGTATKALSATVANFTAEGVTAADASDALFVAVQKGRTTVGETARAFPKVASAAGAMNLELSEAAAIYSTITLTAKSSADASTQAAAFLSATVKPTKAAKDALAELNSEREKSGKTALRIDSKALKDMGSLDFAAQFKGLDETDLAKLFGGERARKGVQGLIANLDKLDESRKAQAKRTGETEKAEDKISKTRAHRLKLLESRIQGAKLDIGEAITPLADTLLPVVTDLAKIGGEFASNHPDIIKGAGALGVAAVGFGKIGQGVVGVSRTVGALRSLNNLMGPAAGKIGGLIGKLGPGKLGMIGAIGGLSFAIGTFIDRQLGLSDKLAARLAGTSEEKRATTRGGVGFAEKKLITDASGKEITDPAARAAAAKKASSRLMRGGTVKGDVTAALYNEGFTAKDIEASYGIGPARSRRSGSAEQVGSSKIDVKVSVEDGRIKVNSVTSSNHEGEVNATTGDGVGLN